MPTIRSITRFVVPLALLVPACRSATDPSRTACGARFCVLFVDSSLNYFNAMPLMVKALAQSNARGLVEVGGSYLPGATLDEHFADGDATRQIATRKWNVVSLGQGPSSRPENRLFLREWTGRFAAVIRAAGARPALYGAWPTIENSGDFPGAIESYRLAATDVDGLLFPVAAAWSKAFARDPNAPLYSSDGWHPTAEGSYLAALVIYGALFQVPVLGMPAELQLSNGTTLRVESNLARLLQLAADEANVASKSAGSVLIR